MSSSPVMESITNMDFLFDQMYQMDQTIVLPDSLMLNNLSTQAERDEPDHIISSNHTLQTEQDDFTQFKQAGENVGTRMHIIDVLSQIQADQPTGSPLPQQQGLGRSQIFLTPEITTLFQTAASEFEKSLATQDSGFNSTQVPQALVGKGRSHLQEQNPAHPESNLAEGLFTSSQFTTFQPEDIESQKLNATVGASNPVQVPIDEEDLSQLPQPQRQTCISEQMDLMFQEVLSQDQRLKSTCNTHQDVPATRPVLSHIVVPRQYPRPQEQASQENWNSQKHFSTPEDLDFMAQDMKPQLQMFNSASYDRQDVPTTQLAQLDFVALDQYPAQPQLSMASSHFQLQVSPQVHQQPLMRGPQAPAYGEAWPHLPQERMEQQYPAGPPLQQPAHFSSAHLGSRGQQMQPQPANNPESILDRWCVEGGEIKGFWQKLGEAPPGPLSEFDTPLCAAEFVNGRPPAASKRQCAIKKKAAQQAVKDAKVSKTKRYKPSSGPSPGSSVVKSPPYSQSTQATSVESPPRVPSPVSPFTSPISAANAIEAKTLPSQPLDNKGINRFQQ